MRKTEPKKSHPTRNMLVIVNMFTFVKLVGHRGLFSPILFLLGAPLALEM